MKNLIEITRLVNAFKESHQRAEEKITNSNRFKEIYEGILMGKYQTDEEVITDLYNTPSGKKSYQKQKERYRHGITAQLLGYNLSRHFQNNYSNARYQCISSFFAANILTMKGKHDAAIELIQNAAHIADKYFFTDIKIMALKKQRYMSSISADKSKFKLYNNKINESLALWNSELKAEEYYQELTMYFVWKIRPVEVIERAEALFVELENIVNKNKSFNINLYYYRFMIKYYHLKKQNLKVLKICDEALAYLESYKAITPVTWFGEFTLEKMETAILMKDYETGLKCAEQCKEYYSYSYYNKIVFMEYYFLMCMHTKRYNEASEIYQNVINKSFTSLASLASQEKWKIFRNFLSLLVPEELNMINNNKICFDVFNCAKDKAGYNFALIIAKMIKFLSEGKLDRFESYEESFNIYVKRYIKKEDFPRSYYFCKMIQILYKNSFEKKNVELETSKYLQKLKEIKNFEHFEVMPYEDLWQIILHQIESMRIGKQVDFEILKAGQSR
ncbi:MAG: hypothetical protein ACR2GN_03730 [Bacteroidia bacterium]